MTEIDLKIKERKITTIMIKIMITITVANIRKTKKEFVVEAKIENKKEKKLSNRNR